MPKNKISGNKHNVTWNEGQIWPKNRKSLTQEQKRPKQDQWILKSTKSKIPNENRVKTLNEKIWSKNI